MEGDREAAALPKMSVLATYLASWHSYRLRLYLFFNGGDNENRTRVQTFSLWLYTSVEPLYPLNYMVRRVGFEPTMFTLRDWFYRPMQHHHRCRRRLNWWRRWDLNPLSFITLLMYFLLLIHINVKLFFNDN